MSLDIDNVGAWDTWKNNPLGIKPPMDTSVTRGSIILGDIHRKVPESHIKALAESIRLSGLQSRIIVERMRGEGYQIIAGQCRYRALQLLGEIHIPVRVFVDLTDEQREYIKLAENVHRKELDPAERDAWAAQVLALEKSKCQASKKSVPTFKVPPQKSVIETLGMKATTFKDHFKAYQEDAGITVNWTKLNEAQYDGFAGWYKTRSSKPRAAKPVKPVAQQPAAPVKQAAAPVKQAAPVKPSSPVAAKPVELSTPADYMAKVEKLIPKKHRDELRGESPGGIPNIRWVVLNKSQETIEKSLTGLTVKDQRAALKVVAELLEYLDTAFPVFVTERNKELEKRLKEVECEYRKRVEELTIENAPMPKDKLSVTEIKKFQRYLHPDYKASVEQETEALMIFNRVYGRH